MNANFRHSTSQTTCGRLSCQAILDGPGVSGPGVSGVSGDLKHQELQGHQARTKTELLNITNDKLTAMAMNKSLLHGIFFRCCMADVLAN